MWTCPRGYQIQRDSTCKSDTEIPHGPVVEISALPSAGDGARGSNSGSSCCTPSVSPYRVAAPRRYVTPSGFTYIPPTLPLRGGKLIRVQPGPFGQTRIFLPWPY
jgi:hypothetical protein